MRALIFLFNLVVAQTIAAAAATPTVTEGFEISNSCQKFPNLASITQASLQKGLTCLESARNPILLGHAQNIRRLFSQTEIPKLRCESMSETMWAKATIPGDRNHPEIVLNSSKFRKPNAHWEETIFHEVFHNLDYVHFFGPEYAYTCASYCFDNLNPQAKALALELCGAKPDSDNSFHYNFRLSQFLTYIDQPYMAFYRVVEKWAKNPKDERYFFLVSELLPHTYPDIAPAFQTYLEARYSGVSDSRLRAYRVSHDETLRAKVLQTPQSSEFRAYAQSLVSAFVWLIQNPQSKERNILPPLDVAERLRLSEAQLSDIASFHSIVEVYGKAQTAH